MLETRVKKVFTIVMAVSVIFVVVMAVLGGICFGRNGWYPEWTDLPKVLAGGSTKDMFQLKDSFYFMLNDTINIVPDAVMLITAFVCGNLKNLGRHRVRALISIVSCVVVSVFVAVCVIFRLSLFGLDAVRLAAFSCIGLLVITAICFWKTRGGRYVLIGIAGGLFKNILVPVAMWFAFLSTAAKIGVVIALAVFVVLMVMKVPAVTTSGASASAAIKDTQVKDKKKEDRVKQLRNTIETCEQSIRGHNRGDFGYGYVDVDVTRRKIEECRRELKMLTGSSV